MAASLYNRPLVFHAFDDKTNFVKVEEVIKLLKEKTIGQVVKLVIELGDQVGKEKLLFDILLN